MSEDDEARDGAGALHDVRARLGGDFVPRLASGLAMGVVAALRQCGLNAPADYAVAGFDDINTLEDFIPGLTTVRLPLEEIGRSAAEAALTGADPAPAAGTIVLRESTGERA